MYAYLNWLQNTLNKISHKLRVKKILIAEKVVSRMFLHWHACSWERKHDIPLKKENLCLEKHIFIYSLQIRPCNHHLHIHHHHMMTLKLRRKKNNVMMIERFQTSFMSTCLVVFLLHIDMVLLSSVRTHNWFFKV